jgi:protein-S-isoprenylcysteine O-methyltransferase Ste14
MREVTHVTDRFVVFSYYAYFVLFLLVEFVFTRFRLGSGGKGDRDRLSFLFFFVLPFVGMFTWMALLNMGRVPTNPSWPQWILGYAIGLLGFAIRIIAKRTLGRFFTVRVQLQKDHEVVDQGIYAAVRHPLYLGYILEWVAPPLILGSPAGFLLVTLPIVIGVLQRIPREEALLAEGLGEKYRSYMGRTKRLIPGVW